MHIIRDETKQTWAITPVGIQENLLLRLASSRLHQGEKIKYGGMKTNPRKTNEPITALFFHIGGKLARKTARSRTGKSTITESTHPGSFKLTIKPTNPVDLEELGAMRDVCFFGSGGLIFLEAKKSVWKTSLVTTGRLCKICRKPMISMRACEWGICDEDAQICNHQYERGAIHGGGLDIGIGEFCTVCGKTKPKTAAEQKMSILDHHLAVEKELGVTIIYKNMGYSRPSDIAKAD